MIFQFYKIINHVIRDVLLNCWWFTIHNCCNWEGWYLKWNSQFIVITVKLDCNILYVNKLTLDWSCIAKYLHNLLWILRFIVKYPKFSKLEILILVYLIKNHIIFLWFTTTIINHPKLKIWLKIIGLFPS